MQLVSIAMIAYRVKRDVECDIKVYIYTRVGMQKNKGTLADAGHRFNTRPVTATMLTLHIKK